jgi:hypothetical protein
VKHTRITVRIGRTQSLENYSNVRPEIEIEGLLEAGDDPAACKAQLLAEARAFVEEVIDEALEREGRGAKFSPEPRFRLAITAEEIYTGNGWTRRQKTTAPERLIALIPQAVALQQGDNPGRAWWGEPYGASSKMRLTHARRAADEWLAGHEGYRLIDCADGDLSRIPAWAMQPPPEPTPEPAPVAEAPLDEDDVDDEEGDDDE